MAGIPIHIDNEYEYEYEFSKSLPLDRTSFHVTTGLLDWFFVYSNASSTIRLICCPNGRTEWSIRCRVFINMNTHASKRNEITNQQSTRFASDDPQLAFFLHDSENAEIQTAINIGKLTVIIKILIFEEKGLWPLVSPSANFMAPNSLTNAELEVEGKKLCVNLDVLSLYSSFFAKQLKLARETGAEFKISILDVDFKAVKMILRMICYEDDCITDSNVNVILIAAKKLEFETILRHCEEFLLYKASGTNGINPRIFQLAHDYDMSALQNLCLKPLVKPKTIDSSSLFAPQVSATEYTLPDVDTDTNISVKLFLEPYLEGTKRTYIITDLLKWKILLRKAYSKLYVFISPECGKSLDYAINWCINLSNIKISLGSETKFISLVTFSSACKEHKISFDIDTTKENKTVFGVEWKIQSIKGLRYFVKESYDYTKGTTSTLKIKLEGKPFFVNLKALAQYSDYLSQILEELSTIPIDEDDDIKCLIIKEVKAEHMTMLLDQVYPTRAEITDENVENLLLLADKLKFTTVVIKCVKFLETRSKFNLEVLQFAVNNKLQGLTKSCLAKFSTSMALLEAVKLDSFASKINKEVKILLIDTIRNLA